MATRIDKTPGLSTSGESILLRRLRSKSPRGESDSNFVGLKRSSALRDVDSPAESLDNILDKLSQLDAGERSQYGGPYTGVDWSVTGDFIDEEIDKQFLLPLAGTSIGGGTLGSTVSITPRIRIEDRLSLANSFFGEGSFPGLHSGPDAQFYRNPTPEVIGYVKFSFTGSNVTVTSLKGPDNITNITTSSVLGTETVVVLDVDGYTIPGQSESISLSGSGISLKLNGTTWTVEDGLDNLTSIRNLLTNDIFVTASFFLTRPYSILNVPAWYGQMPGDSSVSLPSGADDIDPVTSPRILRSENGVLVPAIQRGYWYSRGYVDTRWTATEQDLIGDNSISEDSNMRWFNNPPLLRGEQYNWGVRWDGYLKIGPGIYGLQVQTNVDVRIDLAIGASSPYWVNVFDTRGVSAKENEDTYISSETFNTSTVNSLFRYVTGSGVDDWTAYVPVTIRMFRGGPDKADGGIIIPTEPNLFIKTTTVSSTTRFYGEQHNVTLSGTDGSWSVTSGTLSRIIFILQDVNASVTYSLVAKDDNFFPAPVTIALTTNGTTVSSTTTGLTSGIYILKISPNRSSQFNNNLDSLWKARIASPSATHKNYADLIDGSYKPDVQKVEYDSRPNWWKITEGHPYDPTVTISKNNTPIDGMIPSSFRSSLQSSATGIGLYGNGSSVYSNKPNIILGEAKYSVSDVSGLNYIGFRLTANRLGEGGRLILSGFPVNNSTFTGTNTLGANDLGGDPNHKTVAFANTTSNSARLYLTSNKYYLHLTPGTVTASDNPTSIGLPAFSSPAWISPITVTATQVADDSGFTTNVRNFVAPLTLSVEKETVGGYDLVVFTTTLASILTGGSELSLFNTKFVRFYTEENVAFQFGFVDTGEGLSFSDVLKVTYGPGFDSVASEVPKPPSDRVTPFGFDLPEYGGGLCYPPYSIGNPLLSEIAVSDVDLYDNKPSGNYDVLWGDHTKAGLGGNTLTITERLEFNGLDAIQALSAPETLLSDDYTHRMKVEVPLNPSVYDEDVLEHIGNQEKVKDAYYVYVKLDS
jgi:hypothetical protein